MDHSTENAVPVEPSSLTGSLTNQKYMSLSWTDRSTNETGFKIERKVGTGNFQWLATVPTNTINYTDSSIISNNTYTYRVYAYNKAGASLSYSNEYSFFFEYLPMEPANLVAEIETLKKIRLTWTDQSTNETGFKIEKKIGAGSYSLLATLPSNTSSFYDTSIAINSELSYRVYSFNLAGNIGKSSNEFKLLVSDELGDTLNIKKDLLLWMPFRGDVLDYSGNANHGVNVGAQATTDKNNISNAAYYFNGISNYINVPNLSNTSYKMKSYAVWFNASSYVNLMGYPQWAKTIVGREKSGYADQGALTLYSEPRYNINNAILYYIGQDGVNSNFTPILNEWTHVACTIDALDSIRFYINGKKIYTKYASVAKVGAMIPFNIGASDGRFYWECKIDNLGVWDRALSDVEVLYLYSKK